MKRIWFTQQKQFNYIPLRLGLGYITTAEAVEAIDKMHPPQSNFDIAPKLYTIRPHPLSGDYYVVEGSRLEWPIARSVEPRIEFTAHPVATIKFSDPSIEWYSIHDKIPVNLPELELGVRGVTFTHLRDELLKVHKNATVETQFHINKLERVIEDGM